MDSKKPTAGIILAAGMSNRMNYPKQLIRFKEKFLIEHVLDASLESQLAVVVLVLGHQHHTILDALGEKIRRSRLKIEINSEYQEGMSSSIRTGLREVERRFPSVMFLLGDQPLVDAGFINRLLDQFWTSDKSICVPVFQGKRRNPTLFTRRWYDALLKIVGDVGARHLIESNPKELLQVDVEDAYRFQDIDTESDAAILKAMTPPVSPIPQ
ncbi:MAG: nucleotidyltransferase family protein [Thermodesulfobacteriota bacterium]